FQSQRPRVTLNMVGDAPEGMNKVMEKSVLIYAGVSLVILVAVVEILIARYARWRDEAEGLGDGKSEPSANESEIRAYNEAKPLMNRTLPVADKALSAASRSR